MRRTLDTDKSNCIPAALLNASSQTNAAITIQISPQRQTVTVETTLLREIIVNIPFFFADSRVSSEPYNISESERDRMVTTKDLTSPTLTVQRTVKV